jgi:hypothetical protein
MSSGRELLDTTRTLFIRTGTRLGAGIASLRLNDALFQDAFGFRKIAIPKQTKQISRLQFRFTPRIPARTAGSP